MMIDKFKYLKNFTVQQMKKSWKHLSSDYAGLEGSDERWKTVYSDLGFQVRFSGHPNFRFLGFGRLSSPNQMCYQLEIYSKNSDLITFPKLAHSSRYSNGNPKNFAWSSQKTWKNGIFWPFFQLKCDITLRSCELQV